MDHVGLGLRTGSRGGPAAQGEIHNGADDNASGTAGLIEIAHLLGARADECQRSIIFVAFSGEEWGLLGSQHFVQTPPRPMDVVAMINMDMIGRSTDGYVNVEGMATSPGFADLATAVHADVGGELNMNLADRPASNSDHHSFFVAEIPVIGFFTGLHDDYHMPSDDTDKINAESGALIATMAGEMAIRLAAADERPAFTAPAGPASAHGSAASSASTGSGYRVVFGTSPDMGYQKEDGVRISGVREGTPAAEAGVKTGDVIIAMDGKAIRNLQDYAVLLFAHEPGDKIQVTVRRDGEEVDLEATLTGKAGDS
jgi:membrane-associated protease RseP (regulator of RpoE activity)